jgi:uncharacterized protein GlcG (DUF336 family)
VLSATRKAALARRAVSCSLYSYRETAVILDADGATIVALRGDGAGIHTLDSAHDKAYSCRQSGRGPHRSSKSGFSLLKLAPRSALNAALASRLVQRCLQAGGIYTGQNDWLIGLSIEACEIEPSLGVPRVISRVNVEVA